MLSISDDAPLLVVEVPQEVVHQTVAARYSAAAAVEYSAAAAAVTAADGPTGSNSNDYWVGESSAGVDGVVYRRVNSGDTHQTDPLTGQNHSITMYIYLRKT